MILNLFKKKSFSGLFQCQFYSVFADNLLKTSLITLVTFHKNFQLPLSVEFMALIILGLCMAPYVLFSSSAAYISQRVNPVHCVRVLKAIEGGVTCIALFAVTHESVTLLLLCLFLSFTQSTFFGPLKYALIPEYLPKKDMVAGNGLIEGSTFLAILISTAVASLLSPFFTITLMGVASLLGIYSSFRMDVFKHTPTPGSLKDVMKKVHGLVFEKEDAFFTILALSWFWFFSGVLITFMPPFIDTVLGGYVGIFSFFSSLFVIGITVGSLWCHRLIKSHEHLFKYVPLSGLGISFFFLLFLVSSQHIMNSRVETTLLTLFSSPSGLLLTVGILGLSVCAGLFTVPLYTSLQSSQEDLNNRIVVMSSNNFFNGLFTLSGTLLVAGLVHLKCSLLTVFFITMLLNALFSFKMAMHMKKPLSRSVFRFLLKAFFRVRIHGKTHLNEIQDDESTVIIANHSSFLDGLLLFAFLKEGTAFVVHKTYESKKWFRFLSQGVPLFFVDPSQPMALKSVIRFVQKGGHLVLFPEGRITVTGSLMKIYSGASFLISRANALVLPIRIAGADFSLFSHLKGLRRQHPFPLIELFIQKPVSFPTPSKETSFSQHRLLTHQKLERVMSDMMFETSLSSKETIPSRLYKTMKKEGRFKKRIEDHTRSPLSYNELFIKVNTLACHMAKKTYQGDTIGVLLPTSIAAIVTLLALITGKRIPVLLNYALGIPPLKQACEKVQIGGIITSRAFIQHVGLDLKEISSLYPIWYLEDMAQQITPFEKLCGLWARFAPFGLYQSALGILKENDTSPALDTAAILLTSGSEGGPKAVALSHQNLLANCDQVASVIDFSSRDQVLNVLPLFHSFGLTVGALLPLIYGVPLFLYPSPLHYRIIPALSYDIRATIFFATDSLLKKYAQTAHCYDFFSLRYVFAGAERLSEETQDLWFQKFGLRILQGYGATEASPVIALNTMIFNKKGSVGRLLPHIIPHIDTVEGIDRGGKLWVKGPNIMKGYLNKKTLIDVDPLKGHDTGDIVVIDKEGYLFIEGRLKRFAKIAGEMISLTRVETEIAEVDPQSQHGVVAQPDPDKGERLVLVTTSKTLTRSHLLESFKNKGFSVLMVPKDIHHTESLPLLASGKVDHRTLLEWIEKK